MAAVTDFFHSNTTHTTQLLQRILWETKKKAKPLTGEERKLWAELATLCPVKKREQF